MAPIATEAGPRPARRSIIRRLLPLIGLVLLVLVIRDIDRDAAWEALDRLPLAILALAGLLFAGNLLVKADRWSGLLRSQEIRIPWMGTAVAYFTALLYGAVTVGRVGELLRAGIVVRSGRTLGFAVSSILFDRVLDVAFLVWIAVVLGMATLGHTGAAAVTGVLLLVVGIAGGHIVSGRKIAFGGGEGGVLRAPLRLLIRFAPVAAVMEGGAEFLRGVKVLLHSSALVRAVGWTAMAWVLYLASVWALAYGMFESPPPPGLLALATALSALSTLLPISIHGLGVREVVFAQVLAIAGVAAAEAVALSLVSFVAMLTISVLAGGLAMATDALTPAPAHGPMEGDLS